RSNQLSYAPIPSKRSSVAGPRSLITLKRFETDAVANSGVNPNGQYIKAVGRGFVGSCVRGIDRTIPRSHERTIYRMASLSALPAVKRTTRRLGISMVAPVCGLRAVRALRWAVLNVPKPTKATASPFFNDLVMLSMSESTAAAAPAFDDPLSWAILAMSCCLFMRISSRLRGCAASAWQACGGVYVIRSG